MKKIKTIKVKIMAAKQKIIQKKIIIVLIILLMRKIENIFYIIYSMEIKMYILNIKNHHIMKMKMIMLTLKI